MSLHTGCECDGREFTVSMFAPIICGKKREYMIEVDDKVSFQYILRFRRRCEVDNLKIYTVLKPRTNELLREDVRGRR